MRLDEIKWGIIGCGDVTEVKSGPAFNKIPHSALEAVMRRDGSKAADYAKRHGVPRWTDDVQTLINDPDVNVIYLATPPGSHCELALQIAAAGKPCYVEKPMARSTDECEKMVSAFHSRNLPLFVAYYRRALPHFTAVKKIIEKAQFGPLQSLRYRFANSAQRDGIPTGWRYQPEISGGGLFWDLGSHALDLFDFWIGPLNSVRGHLWKRTPDTPIEEVAAMTATGESGVAFSGNWDFISPTHQDCVELEFRNARITCSIFGAAQLQVTRKGEETESLEYTLPENIQFNLLGNIVESLRTGTPALSTGISALRTNQVIDCVQQTD